MVKHYHPVGRSFVHVFHLKPPCSANYLLLNTCEYSLCKLSRLQFVLSCDYKGRAVLALCWHVIIMASMTTMLGFLESLGTWLFSLAATHVKQIRHRVCFVIESNKQDKLASQQWEEGTASQESSGVSGAAPPPQLRQNVCVGQPPCCQWPMHMCCNIHKLNKQHGVTLSCTQVHVSEKYQ